MNNPIMLWFIKCSDNHVCGIQSTFYLSFFPSESDLYIYIAVLQINETYITPNRIRQEDLNSFSLLNDDSYLNLLVELTDLRFLDSLDIGADWLEAVHTYKGIIESAR